MNNLEQITLDRSLTADEIQRYLFRLVEDLSYQMGSQEKATDNLRAVMDDTPVAVDGVTYYTWIKYSPNADGSDMTDSPEADSMYIGISHNNLSEEASDDPTDYTWSRFRGDDGAEGIGILGVENQYYYSTSPSELVDGSWSSAVPEYDPEKYLWVRQVISYSNGNVTETEPTHDNQFDEAVSKLYSTVVTIGDINIRLDGNYQDIQDALEIIAKVQEDTDTLSTSVGDNSNLIDALSVQLNGLNVNIESIEGTLGELNEADVALYNALNDTTSALNERLNALDNYVAEANQYMAFDPDTGLVLGAEGSDFRTVIDNQRMAFMDGTVTTAYVSGEVFNMNNAVVRGTLRKGGYEEQVRESGDIYIVWVGING